MTPELLVQTARSVVELLVRGEYESAVRGCVSSRLSPSDLESVIQDYGRTLVPPPADWHLDVVQVRGTTTPRWSVSAPLWTVEEGRSDLTLELTIGLNGNQSSVELDDLHVP